MLDNSPEVPSIDVVIAIVLRDGKVLIALRPQDDRHLAGYWEFPGGKVDPDETTDAALHRELAEELAIEVRARAALRPIVHIYPTRRVTLRPIVCDLLSGDPRPLASQQLRWVMPSDLPAYNFPPANTSLPGQIIEYIQQTVAVAEG